MTSLVIKQENRTVTVSVVRDWETQGCAAPEPCNIQKPFLFSAPELSIYDLIK